MRVEDQTARLEMPLKNRPTYLKFNNSAPALMGCLTNYLYGLPVRAPLNKLFQKWLVKLYDASLEVQASLIGRKKMIAQQDTTTWRKILGCILQEQRFFVIR